jgi:hypothetical protein
MKNIFRLLLFSLLFVSCSVQKSVFENGNSSVAFKDFFPIDPTEYSKEVEIVSNNALIKKNIKLLTNEETLSFLNNETVLVYIGQESVQGDFNYLPVTVSAKGGTYKVVMDYMKFATLAEYDDEGSTLLGFSRVGVGLRLTSQITTKEAGINIGDLLSLGIAVKAGFLRYCLWGFYGLSDYLMINKGFKVANFSARILFRGAFVRGLRLRRSFLLFSLSFGNTLLLGLLGHLFL